jgi:hypothetical protein
LLTSSSDDGCEISASEEAMVMVKLIWNQPVLMVRRRRRSWGQNGYGESDTVGKE